MKHWAAMLLASVVGGWMLGCGILLLAMELTDGKAFDSTWF